MMQLTRRIPDLAVIYLMNLLDHDETLFLTEPSMSDPTRLSADCVRPDHRRSMLKFGTSTVRRAACICRSAARQGEGDPEKLAAERYPLHLRHRRRPNLDLVIWAQRRGHPIGKLQLYTACAGVAPPYLLPIVLDAGTTRAYLNDPLYLGMRKTRPATRRPLFFCRRICRRSAGSVPKLLCIHFENWTGTDAVHLSQRYRAYCVYTDDVRDGRDHSAG